MPQKIEFVTLKDKISVYELGDAYTFRKDRPWHWLQKLCLRTLRKLKAFHFNKTVSVERHEIDPQNFMERLWKQKAELHSYFDMRPTVLLIGAEDYAEMMQDRLVNQSISFKAEYWFQEHRTGQWDPHGVSQKPTILQMTVHVIPWMRGCVPLTAEYLR